LKPVFKPITLAVASAIGIYFPKFQVTLVYTAKMHCCPMNISGYDPKNGQQDTALIEAISFFRGTPATAGVARRRT